jgi:hypothetical protein
MAVHFTPFPGAGSAIVAFEVRFKSSTTDVRILTKCAAELIDTSGAHTGGCQIDLDPTQIPGVWDAISNANRGGQVALSVRATTDGTCATASSDARSIRFAEQDVNGGIFYWKSTVSANGTGGQIFAASFGSSLPEDKITGSNNLSQGCYGCHTLSRDGKRMVVNFDDDDSDDEDSDTTHTLVDVAAKSSIDGHFAVRQGFPPGFQSFNADHSLYLSSNGLGNGATNLFSLYEGTNGTGPAIPASVTVGAPGQRPTMMDWSPDNQNVVFVMPDHAGSWDNGARIDDNHIFGGSLFTMPYNLTTKAFGMPTPLVSSKGENNYYPSYSPDGAFIVFNRIAQQPAPLNDCTSTGLHAQSCPNDSFSNPNARLMILPANGAPIDAEAANGSPASAPVAASNSWPRWSPFIQTYQGQKLLWLTFSSTRDYGLRVRNGNKVYCYPADSLEAPGAKHRQGFPANCIQPQIWMAAINLSAAELATGDPSLPAFWLPYQDDTTHNHTAQWTQTVVTQPPPPSMCIPSNGNCTTNPNGCCAGLTCNANGLCSGGIG